MLYSNGVEMIDDEVPVQMVNSGFGYRPTDDVAYIDVPFWGTLRFWKTDGWFFCEGYVPWAGY